MRKLISVIFIVLSFLLLISNIVIAYEKEIKTISTTIADGISKAGKRLSLLLILQIFKEI
jgi:hypothetical protein